MARRVRRGGRQAANWARAALLRGRLGWTVRILALVGIALAGIGELRQSEMFYPLARPFERAAWPHWIDADGDCQDTRTEVLVQESLEPPRLSVDGCEVLAGRWYDPYTDTSFTDPRDLDVDHRVPLGEAHRSGGDRWDRARRQAYANDLSHPDSLIAVDRSANRSKADGDPLSWLPPAWGYRCAYVERWRDTKRRWNLAEDRLEGWWNDAVLWVCARVDG
ncbi:MAG: HNH endonuclease [Thalassobaculum sp.]|uniref:GmrSD restriction endonuclease domain-containing protein n=1 Tax=Thalassobaculum sp. TaxID=2022740 RepID=UPI0032EE067E